MEQRITHHGDAAMTTDTYLLCSEDTGREFVHQYSAADMDELFTTGEQLDLDACKAVVKTNRFGSIRYVSMLAAARQIVN
jgi:hypothetical protein